jgi:hypothetical protein
MGLQPTQGHEDAIGRFGGINDLRRVFNGVGFARMTPDNSASNVVSMTMQLKLAY